MTKRHERPTILDETLFLIQDSLSGTSACSSTLGTLKCKRGLNSDERPAKAGLILVHEGHPLVHLSPTAGF